MIKTFCIYCSGGASRVIKFYNNEKNYRLFKPEGIFYDGNNMRSLKILRDRFTDKIKFLNKKKLPKNEIKCIHSTTSKAIYEFLNKTKADYLLSFGDKIMKKKLVLSYSNRIINFHAAILPAFKGLNAIDKALETNVSFLGNTAHYINEDVDSGEIIIQSAMYRKDFHTYEDVLELQFPMMKIIFRDILNYKVNDADIYYEISNRSKPFFLPEKII